MPVNKTHNKPTFKQATKRSTLQTDERKVVLFNKPFGVLTQFTDGDKRTTLKDYIDIPHIYAAGRLDKDSEGLLLLTNDGKLQNRIASPSAKTEKTYWVQVEGVASEQAIQQLCKGVMLKDGMTAPARVCRMNEPELWERTPPVRFRQSIPTSWLAVTISEGRNRQVRRMTAHVGLPTLRLVRYRIGSYTLDGIKNGEYRVL